MLGKFKKWLGIEGVKVKLTTPLEVVADAAKVQGSLSLESLSEQKISKISVRMIEKYQRGRKKERLTDEYKIGEIIIEKELTVTPEKPLNLDFTLPFQIRKSEVDDFADKNILTDGLAKLAKFAYAVDSTFRVEAEITVAGVALNPFDKNVVLMK